MQIKIASSLWRCAAGLLVGGMLGCSPAATQDNDTLPPDVPTPESVHTAAAALQLYHGTTVTFNMALERLLTDVGILTDELTLLPIPVGQSVDRTALDSRQDLTDADIAYYSMSQVRAHTHEARGFLRLYAPDSSLALRAHMYALEGYAEIYLADLFCSGIPLSTVDFGGDYTLAAGSTTNEVYLHAATLFDSALALASDSLRFQYFAAVGRGRALLGAGKYADAAAAVASVPTDYKYQVNTYGSAWYLWTYADPSAIGRPSVGDLEGVNGLDFVSGNDPRILPVEAGTDPRGNTMYWPDKYPIAQGSTVLTIADGIEARLIEAEAALQANAGDGRWLEILNELRRTALPGTVLPDLADPGTDGSGSNAPRVDLLFRERAFWLYLTAHRQGDLRRLVRQYFRQPNAVYPTGSYRGGNGQYGNQVVVPVPRDERTLNPKYAGCNNLNA